MSFGSVSQLQKKNIYNRSLIVVNVIGIFLSAYAYHVSVSKKAQHNYEAFCDIAEAMSCSRVLTSEYSTGFGFMDKVVGETSVLNQSNSIYGVFFYSLFTLLSFSKSEVLNKLHLTLAVLSNVASVYLAIILIILRDVCLVCVLTYVVNFINLLLVYKKLQLKKRGSQKKKE